MQRVRSTCRTVLLWCLTGFPLLLASDRQQIGQNSYRSHKFGSSGYRRFGGDLRRHRLLIDNEPTKQLFRRAPCLARWGTINEVHIDPSLGKVVMWDQIGPTISADERSRHCGLCRTPASLDLDREPSCQRSHECSEVRNCPAKSGDGSCSKV